MSIKNNTTNLQNLLEQVNNLPEATGGGNSSNGDNGVSAETCIVTIPKVWHGLGSMFELLFYYQSYNNSSLPICVRSAYEINYTDEDDNDCMQIEVAKNSLFVIENVGYGFEINNTYVSGDAIIVENDVNILSDIYTFAVNVIGDCTITLVEW